MKRLTTLALALPVLAGCESKDLPGMNGIIACRDNGGFERKLTINVNAVNAMGATTEPAIYLCIDGTVRWAKY